MKIFENQHHIKVSAMITGARPIFETGIRSGFLRPEEGFLPRRSSLQGRRR